VDVVDLAAVALQLAGLEGAAPVAGDGGKVVVLVNRAAPRVPAGEGEYPAAAAGAPDLAGALDLGAGRGDIARRTDLATWGWSTGACRV
jgi:hypothetical protein